MKETIGFNGLSELLDIINRFEMPCSIDDWDRIKHGEKVVIRDLTHIYTIENNQVTVQ